MYTCRRGGVVQWLEGRRGAVRGAVVQWLEETAWCSGMRGGVGQWYDGRCGAVV